MKNVHTRVVITALISLVDAILKEAMSEFIYLGAQAKEHHKKKTPEKEVQKIYTRMQEIYHTLKPFNSRVKELYPNLIELFDLFDNKGTQDEQTK